MDPHDLVLSKYGAAREKDKAFAQELAQLGLLSGERLLELVDQIDCDAINRERIRQSVKTDYAIVK